MAVIRLTNDLPLVLTLSQAFFKQNNVPQESRFNLKKNVDKKHRKVCRKMLMPELQYLTEMGVNLWITKLWGHVRDVINW